MSKKYRISVSLSEHEKGWLEAFADAGEMSLSRAVSESVRMAETKVKTMTIELQKAAKARAKAAEIQEKMKL